MAVKPLALVRRPEDVRLSQAVATAHEAWEASMPPVEFHPRGSTSDYNQHEIDVEATADQQGSLADRVTELLRDAQA